MKIKVELANSESKEWTAPPGATLLEYLRSEGVWVNSSCGGNGTCQKCRVQIQNGFVGASMADRRAFSAAALANGWRLSCQVRPRTNVSVRVPLVENASQKARVLGGSSAMAKHPRLVCDLGSTGVVLALVDAADGRILSEVHLLNRQVKFGADVMTRLQTAQSADGYEKLRQELRRTLELMMRALTETMKDQVARDQVKTALGKPILISGNSAMLSFLHGWPIEQLAVSPYQPAQTLRTGTLLELSIGPEKQSVRFESLALLGGFVGADTTAGIFLLEARGVPKPWMLVDIGTNTEMVIAGEDGSYWYTSAPAGPAFEGGNITKGMRAEPGAICSARWNEGWQLETINRDRAVGICGSGLIDVFAESLRNGLMMPDGYIKDTIHLDEDVDVFADDVREFQLAKSATRTGIDILIDRSSIHPGTIYLAGTFAQHLNIQNVMTLGLLREDILVEKLGNASLLGTIAYAGASEEIREEFEKRLNAGKKQIELALEDDFQDRFVRHLNF